MDIPGFLHFCVFFNMIFKKYAVLETDSQIGYFFKLT